MKETAKKMGIFNKKNPRPDDIEKDRQGWLRRSLLQKERQKIRARAKFEKSREGICLKEVKKREIEQ